MRTLSKLLLVALIHVATSWISVSAEEFLQGLPIEARPVEVLVGFNLINITDVGEKDETLDFDAAIYLEWNDPRLAYEPAEYGMPESWRAGDYSSTPTRIYQGEFAVRELFPGWRPHVVIPNGIGNRVATEKAIAVWPDGRVEYSESFYVKAETPMDLRRFPFDRQALEIYFHPFAYDRNEVRLVPDDRLARTWDKNVGIADWKLESVTMQERPIEIAYFDETRSEVSEFIVTVQIKRRPMHLLISILFPMVLLVALTWSVFWMDNETLSNRINITFIGILSVVAYYFVILDNVPEASYLTFIDAFIISTFLILVAGVVVAVYQESIKPEERAEAYARIDRRCRWAFPLAYVMTAVILGAVFLKLY